MSVRALVVIGFASMAVAEADPNSDLPGPGLPGDRYISLWTKSPFSIATPEAAATSTDYSLVGIAQFDGVTYVSLIEKQSQEHFVLTSAKPVRNLTLVSVAHGTSGASAVIQRNGETLTLQQDQAPPSAGALPQAPMPPPGPNGLSSVGGVIPPAYIAPPPVRRHRLPIFVPPRPMYSGQRPGNPSANPEQGQGQAAPRPGSTSPAPAH